MRYSLFDVMRKVQPETDDFMGGEDRFEIWDRAYGVLEPLKGAELIAAQQVNEQITNKLRIRWSTKLAGITGNEHFAKDGKTYHPQGTPYDREGRNVWLECQVIEHGVKATS